MNWEKIKKNIKAYNHFIYWFKARHDELLNPSIVIPHSVFRCLYDYFDGLQIMVMPVNNHAKGVNVWNVHVVIDKLNTYNYLGVFQNREKCEEFGFEMAFKLLENNFELLIKDEA